MPLWPLLSSPPDPQQEVARAHARRAALGLRRPSPDPAPLPGAPDAAPDAHAGGDAVAGLWALALSGGGIRSATFCLGVLQAMAAAPDPGESLMCEMAPPEPGSRTPLPKPACPSTRWPLLAQFDFLSTVSGGGYIGGFFSSLFVPGRLSGQAGEDEIDATRRAYEALQEEPPERIHRDTMYDPARPGRAALAWLRDNGRYMAPSGTGDLLYGFTVVVRNWVATQYMLGTLIVMVLALLQALRWALINGHDGYRALESALLGRALGSGNLLWWSGAWAAAGVVMAWAMLPLVIAFWFSHPASPRQLAKGAPPPTAQTRCEPGTEPRPQRDGLPPGCDQRIEDRLAVPPLYWNEPVSAGLLIGAVLFALAGWLVQGPGRAPLAHAAGAIGASVWLAVAWYLASTWLTRRDPEGSITTQRVLLTRWLSTSMQVLAAAAAIALVDTIAQTGWLWMSAPHGAVISAFLAFAVWAVRELARRMADKPGDRWIKTLSLDVTAGVIGMALWGVVASLFDALLLQICWPQGHPDPLVFRDPALARQGLYDAAGELGLSVLLAWLMGRYPGFLNLSTMQSLYSARITRAYLGASNHVRFTARASDAARDVAEPITGDSLSTTDIHRNALAPIHYVNVCINQSVSPGEQLVQRDRKGRPLVLAPGGVYFDQQPHALDMSRDGSELSYPLSFGEWLGVSGAAFSTGHGRGTGLGMSLILGFANVRLGRWWQGLPVAPGHREHWFRRRFATQAYLFDEFRGLFYGSKRRYQYLSDGGHFENTGLYELLRLDRPRGVRLIVLCDCGGDPHYQFEDLANLTRLVRIDHGLEIRVNPRAHVEPLLDQVFARPEDFRRDADGRLPDLGGRCAVLLDVLGTARTESIGLPAGALHARVILIKPVLPPHVGVDLAQYQANNASFPQETTIDQFFDEAQWESYRQLGKRLAERVFLGDGTPGHVEKLWQVCLQGLR